MKSRPYPAQPPHYCGGNVQIERSGDFAGNKPSIKDFVSDNLTHCMEKVQQQSSEPLFVIIDNYIRTKPRRILLAWGIGILAAAIGTHYVVKKYRQRPKRTVRACSSSTRELIGKTRYFVCISKLSEVQVSSRVTPMKIAKADVPSTSTMAHQPTTQTVLISKPAEKKSVVEIDRGSVTRLVKPIDAKRREKHTAIK
ncbi:hypothetical protein DICVIV_10380 [Dictyocaulus viviparus]|uniref:Uncharacterized protein n=1 Tax=Dictyocaulus viviparus TaxID=29172 RepID=A0A0D8XG64_DICVI|nr:hypothetical protein DICVIV_10380 [Dictyocaulus viviparus]